MEVLSGLVVASGWASGVNLYLVTLLLGGAGRLGLAEVPEVLTRTDLLLAAGVLFAIEFLVDKLPYLDTLWDLAHTVIRPLGGAGIGAVLSGDVESGQQVVAAVAAGGLALAGHLAKATLRAVINLSPEPVSNIVASFGEDGLVVAVIWLAVAAPAIALALVALLLVTGSAITISLIGRARRGLAARRARRLAR